MFATAFGLHSWDRNLYTTPEYKPYMEIQHPRAALGDWKNYNANAVIEDLIEAEKSNKDFELLTTWTFYDTEAFAKDSMQSFVNVINNYHYGIKDKERPKLILKSLANSLHSPIFWFWIFTGLILFVTNKQKFPYIWGSLIPICYMMFLLITTQRGSYRVETGLWLYAAILAVPQWKVIQSDIINRIFNHKVLISAATIIVIANIFSYATSDGSIRNPVTGKARTLAVDDSTDYNQVLAYIDSNPNTMFLTNMRTYMVFSHHKMPPYKAEPFGSYRNIVSFGYWTPYLPEITQTLAEYGITNPMRQVIDSNVTVINEPMLGDFLMRHYYRQDSLGNPTSDTVIVDTLRTIGKTNFFKYRLVQNERNE